MAAKKMSRRALMAGAAQASVAAMLPLRGLTAAQAQGQGAGQLGQTQQPDRAQQPYVGSGRAAWMQNLRYAWGVMTHYLSDWQARVNKLEMTVELWNKMVDGFDVAGMSKRLEQVGAGHYQISIGQNSGYYCSPNAVYDKFVGITPSKCSRRDLIADFYEPLRKRDIKLMVYLPSGAPGSDRIAREALEWNGVYVPPGAPESERAAREAAAWKTGPWPNKNFQRKWEQVIAEWSKRWGTKVAGWWFDGCYTPNAMYRSVDPPNFTSFAAAARAGNSDSAVAFNPGVIYRLISVSPDEDFTAGEIDKPDQVMVRRSAGGRIDGTQLHMLSFLGETWGMGAPRFTVDQVIGFTKKVRDYGGSVTWDVPVAIDGTIADAFLEQLTALGKAFPRGSS